MLIAYHPDSNGILATPLKNRTVQQIVDGWRIINNRLKQVRATTTTWILNNECSSDFKKAFTKIIKWQCVPPHQHRTNAVEHAIQTFNHHMKSCLATKDENFPFGDGTASFLSVNWP